LLYPPATHKVSPDSYTDWLVVVFGGTINQYIRVIGITDCPTSRHLSTMCRLARLYRS
jgi:hypothetical protein